MGIKRHRFYAVDEQRYPEVAVQLIDFADAEPGFGVGPRTIDRAALCYLRTGVGWVRQSGQQLSVSGGDFYYLRANAEYTFRAAPDSCWQLYSFTFRHSSFEAYANQHFHPEQMVGRPKDAAAVCGHLDRMLDWAEWPDDAGVFGFVQHLHAMFDAFIRCHAERAPVVPDGLNRAREHIEENAVSECAIDDLAELAGMSRYHFMRQFRTAYGVSARQFHIQCRLRIARQCLLEGDRVTEAAAAAGFDDLYYFSRLFKQKHGVPPSRYGRGRVIG